MVKIVIDAGHGINTPGKRCLKSIDKNETREWTLNSRVANYVEAFLKDYEGYEILRVDDRTGKTDIPLSTRTRNANNWKADIYISIHHNAGINGGTGGGITVYRYPNSTKTSKAMLQRLYDLLIKHTGLKGNRSSPLNDANFQVLRETSMTAILIEGGFMDSKTDVPIILSDKFARQYASAIVEFLVAEYKLKGSDNMAAYKRGDTGAGVKALQEDLIKIGYNLAPYGADGSFGPAMDTIVRKFQKDHGLVVDGSFGPANQAKLKELLAKGNTPAVNDTELEILRKENRELKDKINRIRDLIK